MITTMALLAWSFRRFSAPSRNLRVVVSRSVSLSAVSVECGSSMISRSPRWPVSEPNAEHSRLPVSVLAKLISPRGQLRPRARASGTSRS
jgi:hypothetical protein